MSVKIKSVDPREFLSDIAQAYERMMKRVVICEETGCWVYTGSRSQPRSASYPGHGKVRLKINGRWKNAYVHRVAYQHRHGPIPPGMVVRHKCDNSLCVRDECHELGTAADNNRDTAYRGRVRNQVGATGYDHRTTEDLCPF